MMKTKSTAKAPTDGQHVSGEDLAAVGYREFTDGAVLCTAFAVSSQTAMISRATATSIANRY
jgi:hypothetical protein